MTFHPIRRCLAAGIALAAAGLAGCSTSTPKDTSHATTAKVHHHRAVSFPKPSASSSKVRACYRATGWTTVGPPDNFTARNGVETAMVHSHASAAEAAAFIRQLSPGINGIRVGRRTAVVLPLDAGTNATFAERMAAQCMGLR